MELFNVCSKVRKREREKDICSIYIYLIFYVKLSWKISM